MSEIAIIGETDSVLIFKSMGADCYIVAENEIENVFKDIYNKNYKIIFVTEKVYKKCSQYIEKERVYPQVTPLQNKTILSKLTKIATGMEI
ncbi:MAG: V-type ATP synthase subunit F [Endomicrobiia bacterium]